MKPISLLSLSLSLVAAGLLLAQPSEYSQLKALAEKHFSDGSYKLANDAYQKAKALKLSPADTRWVEFRLADTQWRSEASTQKADNTKLQQGRQQLEILVRDINRNEDKDLIWVEVQESLGDFWWTRRNQQNWGQAWNHYNAALEWWAGARDVELARERYLKIVWRIALPPGRDQYYSYGYYGNVLPVPVLDNVLRIAQTDNDKAHANYLIAMTIRNQGGSWEQRARVPESFESAIKAGKGTDWYDDALYHYAEWMANQGRAIPLENGGWTQKPDYVKAVEMFRRLVREFKKGETRYFDQAEQQIKNITQPQVSLGVSHIFLPDSEIQYHLNWRNVKTIDLALYAVDLTQAVQLDEGTERRRYWLNSIDLEKQEKIKSWKKDTKDQGDHVPGGEALTIDGKLRVGAYVVEAKGGGQSARDLMLVTDASMVLKTSGRQTLVYVCNALHGAPLPGAKVKLWERYYEGNNTWRWREQAGTANKDGIAVFELKQQANNSVEIFAAAVLKDRQTFSAGNAYHHREGDENWRIYAFTDRPAYRPQETVNWKFVARRYNGSVYSTPANQTIWYRIDGPDNALVKEGEIKLNEFGSVWGSLDLTETMKLGEYRVSFRDQSKNHHIGNATLFRLEEYKLPEFKVTVKTPEENGQKKAFRLGETVEVTIQADYYFGGPVSEASVEVIVYQNPFYQYYERPREFPWFYEDMSPTYNWRRWGRGGGQVFKRETLKTDAMGKATLRFETQANAGQDFEYRVEARVTDASRREITGNGTVRVTRQRYYVYANADHNIYRPKDKVRVEFTAQDANSNPVQTEGTVKVTREYWYEIWLKPDGTEVKGDELKRLQAKHKIWPPPPERPDQKDWRLKFRGYERDEILTVPVKTDANGKGELTFTPAREGYYRVAWTSEDKLANRATMPIHAATTVWVATGATTELGYRHGGVEIIVDKDTFRVGNEAQVMLVANAPDRYVLFSLEGEDLYSYQLVHLTGNVKLVDVVIEEKHVPNIFLGAAMVADRQIHIDSKQVIVPPTKNFLTVEVKSDREQYEPREDGTLTITTKDHDGKPVAAEVSFGLVDESVYYIQNDYAGDPRQFYFGQKRPQRIQTQSTFNQKSFARLVEWGEGKDKQLLEDYEVDERKKQVAYEDRSSGTAGGAGAMTQRFYRAESESLLAEKAAVTRGLASAPAATAAGIPMDALALGDKQLALGARFDVAKSAESRLGRGPDEPAVQVRSDFRSTVLWKPDVVTDRNGHATVKVTYPDSLTGWKATARAVSAINQFGIADAATRTKQPLIVRLQAPRFFVVGDQVVISAVVNNNTDQPLETKVSLEAIGGLSMTSVSSRTAPGQSFTLTVPPNGEARADWKAEVKAPGEVKLKTIARGGKYSDAMEKTYLAHEHGIEKFITKSGKVRGKDITVKLDIPKERKADSTSLTVQVTPSMAVTMLDALPYLINYPYGCTEQTMSRFLPAAITAKTLKDLGLQPEDVMTRAFGGIEQATGLKTHPDGKKDLQLLNDMVKAGLNRLYDFQHGDGGWGWWKEGQSDHWMTAYVVWGLALARDAGTEIKPNVIERGASFLNKELVEQEENPDMQAWMLHALAVFNASKKSAPTKFQNTAFENLWNRRDALNAYTRALLALSAHHLGRAAQAKTLIANLENGVKKDDRPDASVLIDDAVPNNPGVIATAHWGEDGIYWRWSDGGVEATAFALRALLTIDPKNALIEPVTNWLIKNRRGAQWSNTRDTAVTVLAMNDYLRVSGELKPEIEYEVLVNGRSIAKKKIAGADIFNAPSRFTIDSKLIRDGDNRIQIKRRNGDTPVYFAAEAKYFSLEEPIPPAGNEIFVKREYYKLVGRPTLLKGYVYDKVPLKDGEPVKSGERIETVLTIEAKNNYEYLVFEDLKPAGIEAVEIRSGQSLYARELKSGAVDRKFTQAATRVAAAGELAAAAPARMIAPARPRPGIPQPPPTMEGQDYTGRNRWVYQELRDRKVALFLDKLPEGVWEIRYDFRAEVPGDFHALPVLGHAMYVPEIRCNGAEIRVVVADAK
ncbi:MAG: alpha-2-macroglobulin family protein [Verrucomicrobiota bacterium]